MAQKRISQHEGLLLVKVQEGTRLTDAEATRLIKRGLGALRDGRLVVTKEGDDAFYRFGGMRLSELRPIKL